MEGIKTSVNFDSTPLLRSNLFNSKAAERRYETSRVLIAATLISIHSLIISNSWKDHELAMNKNTVDGNNIADGLTWQRAVVTVAGAWVTGTVAAADALKVTAFYAGSVAVYGIQGAVHCVNLLAGDTGPMRVGDTACRRPELLRG